MIRIFFGSPGCGKTTLAVRNIRKEQLSEKKYNKWKSKKIKNPIKIIKYWLFPLSFYDRYFTNFDCTLAEHTDLKDLGQWTFPKYSHITVDESGIEYNNRKFKSLSQDTIKWLKLHRHYHCDVDFYSQSWEDTDITILRLATEYWHVRKLGPFTLCRKIRKFVTVQDETKQIIDGYEFKSIIRNILPYPFHEKTILFFLRKPYYKYFDSYETPPTPIRYNNKAPTK